jgi:hypothetical protein
MISLVCPSRGRPEAFADMVCSAHATASYDLRDQVVAYVDNDDPSLDAYRRFDYPVPTSLVVGERCTLSDAWNRAAVEADGDVLMLAADDLRFRTPAWDILVAGTLGGLFPDGIGLVYGRDGHADRRMATHPFVTSRWVEVVGRFTAPYFVADYVDLWLHDVATRISRAVFLPGLLVEHMHPAFGKGEWDETHRERMLRASTAGLPEVWDETEHERVAEAARLLAALSEVA